MGLSIDAPRLVIRCALCNAALALLISGCAAISQGDSGLPAKDADPAAPASVSQALGMRELTLSEKAVLADAFSAGLNEPESAKFKWTKIPKISGQGRRTFDYCAQINLKDEHGAYRGFRPFLATVVTENGAIIGGTIGALNSDDRPENRDVIPTLCRQKGLNPTG
jgi:hypothetical protein